MQKFQMQHLFTKWVFNPLDQSNIMKNISWILDPVLAAIEVSRQVSTMVNWYLTNFYDSFSYDNLNKELSDDPFQETKKKCHPANLDHLTEEQRKLVKDTVLQYSCVPITLENIEWESFRNPRLNNLIIDKNGILMQLLNILNSKSTIPPKQKWMIATEYRLDWKLVARIFNQYIDTHKTLH